MDDVGVKKYIDFSFVVLGFTSAWLFSKITETIWATWRTLPNPEVLAGIELSTLVGITIGVGIVFAMSRGNLYGLATESGVELKKTIWPNWDSTKINTVVVIIVTFIMGFTLFLFDVVWRKITAILYQ